MSNDENVDWYAIARQPDLSEDFIDKHADELNWVLLVMHQTLSPRLVVRHRKRLGVEGFYELSTKTPIAASWDYLAEIVQSIISEEPTFFEHLYPERAYDLKHEPTVPPVVTEEG